MPDKRTNSSTAQQGDRLRRIECRCGMVLVRVSSVEGWRCGACRSEGQLVGATVVLGPGGSLPPPDGT